MTENNIYLQAALTADYTIDRVTLCGLDRTHIEVLNASTAIFQRMVSTFRVVVDNDDVSNPTVPAIAGEFTLDRSGVHFVPQFPFEAGLKYRAVVGPLRIEAIIIDRAVTLSFELPENGEKSQPPIVSQIYPTSATLPENLLRFYVCFSEPMQRGRALDCVRVLDIDGNPIEDALYRAPVELWNRDLTILTVLLDPGRLKRFVGPNRALGAPLMEGHVYVLEIGDGLLASSGQRLREPIQKRFEVSTSIRERVDTSTWEVHPPSAGNHEPLRISFSRPLDWTLALHSITVCEPDGNVVPGQVALKRCEEEWSFLPNLPWKSGHHRLNIDVNLEDSCGNSVRAPFDKSICSGRDLVQSLAINQLSFVVS